VGFGQGVIEFDGLARCFVGQEFGLLRRDGNVAGGNVVGIGKAGIGERIVGVGGDGLLK